MNVPKLDSLNGKRKKNKKVESKQGCNLNTKT